MKLIPEQHRLLLGCVSIASRLGAFVICFYVGGVPLLVAGVLLMVSWSIDDMALLDRIEELEETIDEITEPVEESDANDS